MTERINPLYGEEPTPVPFDEALANAKTVEEVNALRDKDITKGFSPAFGSRSRRRAQLVARLKNARRYKKPVKGGTGKQARSRRKTFG